MDGRKAKRKYIRRTGKRTDIPGPRESDQKNKRAGIPCGYTIDKRGERRGERKSDREVERVFQICMSFRTDNTGYLKQQKERERQRDIEKSIEGKKKDQRMNLVGENSEEHYYIILLKRVISFNLMIKQ